MNVAREVKKLNFKPNCYVVVAGGPLSALGIRETRDIDIAVTSSFYTELRATKEWAEEERWGKFFLKKENVEIIPEIRWERYDTSVEELIASAIVIDDVPFMNLKELLKFKQALGRPKDLDDIKLIDTYLQNKI